MREVGCLFTLLESGDQRCERGTGGAGGEKVGGLRALQGKARRGEGNGQHEVHFGVSDLFYKTQLCHGVRTSERNSHRHQALSWADQPLVGQEASS